MNKALGQNFLTDENIVQKIVSTAQLTGTDLVLEIGPGIGSMTRELCAKAGYVLAVEIDKYLIPALKENLREFQNVEIIHNDVLKVDIREMIQSFKDKGIVFEKVKVVANLPYYITTPIIMKLLEENPGIDKMVFMIQKEVADRMAAKPGGKDYGALTVAVQYYSEPKKAFNVPPQCFVPQPNVDSTVIVLDIYSSPQVVLHSQDLFFKTVKASFGQRRKTLVNALANAGIFNESKEGIKQILVQLGIDEKQRGETLSIAQFAELANVLYKRKL